MDTPTNEFENFIEEGLENLGASSDLTNKYLTFQIGDQHYGLTISNVIEIVQVQPITSMPELPYYAKGIINMRGRVIPIIDVNLRFGMPEKEYTSRTCFIIVDIEGHHVGFVVDAVEEVMDIEREQISPPPSFQGGGGNRFVIGIGKMAKHMILLLDSQLLVSDGDLSMFSMN